MKCYIETSRRAKAVLAPAAVVIAAPAAHASAGAKPLKVYMLARQSNMEGQATVETLDYIGAPPPQAAPPARDFIFNELCSW